MALQTERTLNLGDDTYAQTVATAPAERISDPTALGYWAVALTGYSNPKYFHPTDTSLATGFDISDAVSLTVAFENTATHTTNFEQTLDPTGATGWFGVSARLASNTTGALVTSGSGNNSYVVPVVGVLMRLRTSALTVADVRARISKQYGPMPDLSPGQVTISGTLTVQGGAAQDAAIAGQPFQMGVEARNTQKTAMSATGDVVYPQATMDGRLVVYPHNVPDLTWAYAALTGGIVSSTADVTIKAALATYRNYINTLTINHDLLGAATEFVIKDAATVIFRGKLQTPAIEPETINFDPPLRGSVNTALNFALITSVTGGVFVNAQGFTGV